jgi:hypothetical protein
MSVLYLGEHSSNPDVTGICVHSEPLSWFGVGKDRRSAQGFLERLDSGFHLWGLLEGLLLLHEFRQWFCNIGEAGNKMSVIRA